MSESYIGSEGGADGTANLGEKLSDAEISEMIREADKDGQSEACHEMFSILMFRRWNGEGLALAM